MQPARTGRDEEIKYRPNSSINHAAIALSSPLIPLAMLCSRVFNTLASPASPLPTSSNMPLAKPTSRAGAIIIRAPSVNEDAMTLTVIPLRRNTTPMMPITSPIVKNWLAISGINHALTITPQTTQIITAVSTSSTNQSPSVKRRSTTSSCCSRKKRSDSCTRERSGFFFDACCVGE